MRYCRIASHVEEIVCVSKSTMVYHGVIAMEMIMCIMLLLLIEKIMGINK